MIFHQFSQERYAIHPRHFNIEYKHVRFQRHDFISGDVGIRGGPDDLYPMVPGQTPGFQTPFQEPGPTGGLYFGVLESRRRWTYLFEPLIQPDPYDPAGITLVVWERYDTLWLLEKCFAAHPEISDPEVAICSTKGESQKQDRFLVFLDPMAFAPDKIPAPLEHKRPDSAIQHALRSSRERGVRGVVGRLVGSYPLDY